VLNASNADTRSIMELRHLRVFIAVADELHFGRAAERLHMAQSGVSGQICQLERELDVRLFERTARRVALTEAGEMFLDDAHEIVRRADAACLGARAWRAGNTARLRIGYMTGSLPRRLPFALGELAAGPDTPAVQLTTGAPGTLLAQLRDGSLDVAIISLPAPVRDMHVVALGPELPTIAVRVGRFDRSELEVPMEIVARETVLTAPRRMNPGLHDAVVSAFTTAGLPSPLVELDDATPEQLVLQVAAGAGMALVAESAADRMHVPGVAFRRLVPATPVEYQVAAVTADPDPSGALASLLTAMTRPAVWADRAERRAAHPPRRRGHQLRPVAVSEA
jgi:DNA-binding transcriptional LysR family regulator